MKKKYNQCYLFLGTIIMLLVSCLCSFIFVKSNLNQAVRQSSFESIYVNTNIDYIVPGPSKAQIEELENEDKNGIATVTPYYETTEEIDINGISASGVSILFPFAEKMVCTPYNAARIINGATTVKSGDAIVDQKYVDRNDCAIGDEVTISIAGQEYMFEITSIAETNTYYNSGTIAMVLSAEDAQQLEVAGIRYSAAYISAEDTAACEAYLYSEYKPLARLKDKVDFDSEDIYNQHLQNFNEVDWSKEITNCKENYNMLSVKYENVQTGIWNNIIVMSIIVVVVIVMFNVILLTTENMKSFMKSFLMRKSGTKNSIKTFYKNGIRVNVIVFSITSIGLYILLALQAHTQLVDLQLMNCLLPIFAAIFISIVMVRIANNYVEKHYKVIVIKKKGLVGEDPTEEIQVEVI